MGSPPSVRPPDENRFGGPGTPHGSESGTRIGSINPPNVFHGSGNTECMVIRSGEFVEDRLVADDSERSASQLLAIDTIYRQRGDVVVGSSGVVRRQRSELARRTRSHFQKHAREDANTLLKEAGVGEYSSEEFYRLTDKETYYVEFAEDIDVPPGSVGLIAPRENLLRAGVQLQSRHVWPSDDAAEAVISLEDRFALVSAGAVIAELVVVEPEST